MVNEIVKNYDFPSNEADPEQAVKVRAKSRYLLKEQDNYREEDTMIKQTF